MELLILWAACAFACYKIAERNGRDPILGAVLGALFGLLAILGYFIAGEKKTA